MFTSLRAVAWPLRGSVRVLCGQIGELPINLLGNQVTQLQPSLCAVGGFDFHETLFVRRDLDALAIGDGPHLLKDGGNLVAQKCLRSGDVGDLAGGASRMFTPAEQRESEQGDAEEDLGCAWGSYSLLYDRSAAAKL